MNCLRLRLLLRYLLIVLISLLLLGVHTTITITVAAVAGIAVAVADGVDDPVSVSLCEGSSYGIPLVVASYLHALTTLGVLLYRYWYCICCVCD